MIIFVQPPNAGAAVHHIHVRDKLGRTTGDLNVYNEVISKVNTKCPIITQIGNGIGGVFRADGSFEVATQEERMDLTTITPKPDMLTHQLRDLSIRVHSGHYFLQPSPVEPGVPQKMLRTGHRR